MMKRIKNYLLAQGVSEERSELVAYGIYKLALFWGNVILYMAIGFVFRCPIEMGIFLMTYIPLRIYAGGFHLQKLVYCEIFSLIIICMVALTIKTFSDLPFQLLNMCISIIAVLMHFFLAPQDNANKRLYDYEMKRYKIFVRALILLYFLAIILLLYTANWRWQLTIMLSMLVSAASLLENHVYERIKRV